MATSLTNQFISDFYVGLLHTGAVTLSSSSLAIVYDGTGNQSALSIGSYGNGVIVSGDSTFTNKLSTSSLDVGGLLTTQSLVVSGSADLLGNTSIRGGVTSTGSNVTGDASISGNLSVGGSTSIAGTLSSGYAFIDGSSDILGNVYIAGSLNSGQATLNGNSLVDGDFKVNYNSTVIGDSVVIGGFTAGSRSSFNGGIAVDANSYFNGDLEVTGAFIANAGANITSDTYIDGNLSISGTANYQNNIACNKLDVRDALTVHNALICGNITYPQSTTNKTLVDVLYPVDSIYLSFNDNNPANHLGLGTWVQVALGKFLVGVGSGVDKNSIPKTFAAGDSNPGEYSHTLTVGEIPGSGGGSVPAVTKGTGANANASAFEMVPPSYGIYVWRRTA